jgi:hypothetical protein
MAGRFSTKKTGLTTSAPRTHPRPARTAGCKTGTSTRGADGNASHAGCCVQRTKQRHLHFDNVILASLPASKTTPMAGWGAIQYYSLESYKKKSQSLPFQPTGSKHSPSWTPPKPTQETLARTTDRQAAVDCAWHVSLPQTKGSSGYKNCSHIQQCTRMKNAIPKVSDP